MIFLLDSNAFSDLMRKDPHAEAHVAALSSSDQLMICPIVRGEILYGLARLPQGRRRDDLVRQAEPLFGSMACLPVPEAAADAYARVKRTREKRGLSLDENDLWIAATAIAVDATLVTRDRDFVPIDGLSTIDWSV